MAKAGKYLNKDFFDDLRSPTAKKRFVTLFLVVAILSVIPYVIVALVNDTTFAVASKDFIESVSANVFTSSFVILTIFVGYMVYIGEDIERPNVETIRPRDINNEIRSLPKETSFYYLWARSGTYFRSETIRELDEIATSSRRTIEVYLLLPDPEIEELAIAYEKTMASLGEERSNGEKLLKNAVATSLTCAILMSHNRNLRVRVYLSKFLPAFRVDLSEQGAVITEDDKSLYALKFARGSQFFEMYRTMMLNEIEISREVPLSGFDWHKYQLGSEAIKIDELETLGFKKEAIRPYRDEILLMASKKDHRYL